MPIVLLVSIKAAFSNFHRGISIILPCLQKSHFRLFVRETIKWSPDKIVARKRHMCDTREMFFPRDQEAQWRLQDLKPSPVTLTSWSLSWFTKGWLQVLPLGAKRMSQYFPGHALASIFGRLSVAWRIWFALFISWYHHFSKLRREKGQNSSRSNSAQLQKCQCRGGQESGWDILCDSTVLPKIHPLERAVPGKGPFFLRPRVEMLAGISQLGFTLGCFQHGRKKKNELQPSMTRKFQADECNQEISLSLQQQSFFYRLEGDNTVFEVWRENLKPTRELLRATCLERQKSLVLWTAFIGWPS